MGKAKEIEVRAIAGSQANQFVRKYHYSGKVVQNSRLHLGCFLYGRLGGVMQFGSPIDKRNILDLVATENQGYNKKWNEMLELNRMAFSDLLPKNSESRCIAIATKLIRKNAPHVKWILSFADGTQCGDGTIYRASGFRLTGIKRNNTIVRLPSGEVIARHGTSRRDFTGAKQLEGYQFRYILLIDKKAKLAVPEIPFSKIQEEGIGMYKGEKKTSASSTKEVRPEIHPEGRRFESDPGALTS